jgi:hypothetical protein
LVGVRGAGAFFNVCGGSTVSNGNLAIAYVSTSNKTSNNVVTISGGSKFINYGNWTYIGDNQPYQASGITNFNNGVVVSDTNSLFSALDVTIGYHLLETYCSNNVLMGDYIIVSNGASAIMSNLTISSLQYASAGSYNSFTTNNQLIVNGGSCYITNALANGFLYAGVVALNSTGVVGAAVTVTNSGYLGTDLVTLYTNTIVNISTSSLWSNKQWFVSGTNASCGNAISLSSGSTIYSGYGISNFGTLSLDAGSRIVATSTVYMGSSTILNICVNTDTPTNAYISGTSVIGGGTFTMSNLGLNSISSNYNFKIFPNFSGSFAVTNFPVGWAFTNGFIYYTNVATNQSFGRLQPNAQYQLQPNQANMVNQQ